MQSGRGVSPRRTARGYFGGGACYVVAFTIGALIFERGSTFIECNVIYFSTRVLKKQVHKRFNLLLPQ